MMQEKNDSKEKLLDTKGAHQLLTEMLVAFAEYCEKHGLRYYLVGGTLLGAIRHKGFIPWDDDIDVGMPRPDYEKLLDLVEKEPISEEYKIVSSKQGSFTLPFAELCHVNTRLERETSEFINESSQVLHLFLDIFPQDGWPDDLEAAKQVVKKAEHIRFMNQETRAKFGGGKSFARKIGKIPVLIVAKAIGSKRFLKKMDQLATTYSYDESKYVGAITYGIYGIGERCVREEVVDFAKVEFEGHILNAPGCWDSYLKGIYGDYMQLPPVEKRISHGMKVWLKEK